MRKVALLPAAALLFALWPSAARLGPVPGSLALVALAVVLALAASGGASAIAVAGGAIGAFAGGVLAGVSPALAGAVLTALCLAERGSRVRSGRGRVAHTAVAMAAGAVAGSLAFGFGAASLGLRGVAVVVGAVLLALPLLVEADDPLAHALDGAAAEITGPAKESLRKGAELRRTLDEELLDRRTARQVRQTWDALLRLAEARVRLERSRAVRAGKGSPAEAVIGKLDAKIADHVEALTRAYTAVDAARGAAASLDDAALRGVELTGESFEHVSRAIVDDV